MKTATAKDLRTHASAILKSVQKGEEVVITVRGESVAVMKPIRMEKRRFTSAGFGMWKDRKDMKDVEKWLADRRNERFQR